MRQRDRREILKQWGVGLAGAVTVALTGCVTNGDDASDQTGGSTDTAGTDPGSASSGSTTTNASAKSQQMTETGTEQNETGSGTDNGEQSQLSIKQTTLEGRSTCQDPSVTFETGKITVVGCVTGPNGCHKPVVKRTTAEDAAIELVIESVDTSSGMTACTDVIVENGYRVTIQTAGQPAETVSVVHDDMTGQQTVTTAKR